MKDESRQRPVGEKKSDSRTADRKEKERGLPSLPERERVEDLIAGWPEEARIAARAIMGKYGPPGEVTASRLTWQRIGPWKRTVVHRDGVPHHFPRVHSDVLEQSIDYRIPPEKIGQVVAFNGSLMIDRTGGEVAVRCDSEEVNLLILNLMHDVVTGRHTVDEARRLQSEQDSAFLLKRLVPYTEKLCFQPAEEDTADLDRPSSAGPVVHQVKEKIKDILKGEGM